MNATTPCNTAVVYVCSHGDTESKKNGWQIDAQYDKSINC